VAFARRRRPLAALAAVLLGSALPARAEPASAEGPPGPSAPAAHPEVLVVVNGASPVSRAIGELYRARRGVPRENVCSLELPLEDPSLADPRSERVTPEEFERLVRAPVARCLQERDLVERVQILVTAKGVPLRIEGPPVEPRLLLRDGLGASVEAELALLFSDRVASPGVLRTHNPYFGSTAPFASWKGRGKPLRYLVARLDAYPSPLDAETGVPRGVRALLEQADAAPAAPGPFVVDEDPALKPGLAAGNALLLRPAAAALQALGLPLVHETTSAPAADVEGLRGLAGWGSNASDALHRPGPPFFGSIGGRLLPGRFGPRALAVTLVSTDGRSFASPPRYGQSLAADLLALGAAGAAAHVAEPTLSGVARPHILLREFALGAPAAEAFYRSVPYLGWTNVFVGDPLARAAAPVPRRPEDQDGDGVPDASDTCRDLPDPDQRDTDGDGFGNLCDADVDGDGWVTSSWGRAERPGDVEQIALTARALAYVPHHDLDGDGHVDRRDVSLAHVTLFQRPGPGRGTLPKRSPEAGRR
jgi:uncharacterized protein (TIGR03790 family)